MPLHLLGKKSWNVYNTANVERVRRDEVAAQAREEERERLMQEQDAVTRTALLRGEAPPTFDPLSSDDDIQRRKSGAEGGKDGAQGSREERKRKRRLRGEDETEHAIRLALQDREAGEAAKQSFASQKPDLCSGDGDEDVAIVDHAGHIQLFAPPDEKKIRKQQQNAEHEADKKRKQTEKQGEESAIGMKFSDAAGFRTNISSTPWYTNPGGGKAVEKSPGVVTEETEEGKNVWGRPDPGRKDRDKARVNASDPFAAMQQAQGRLKQVESEREKWKREKERELREVQEMQRIEKEERRKRRKEREREQERGDMKREDRRDRGERRRKERRSSVDSFEGFSLDAPALCHHRDAGEERKRTRHGSDYDNDERHHRKRSRSPGKDSEGKRRRHRSREHEYHHSSRHEKEREYRRRSSPR